MIDEQEEFAEVVRANMGREPDFEAIGHATSVSGGLDLIETIELDLVAVNVHIGQTECPLPGFAGARRVRQSTAYSSRKSATPSVEEGQGVSRGSTSARRTRWGDRRRPRGRSIHEQDDVR